MGTIWTGNIWRINASPKIKSYRIRLKFGGRSLMVPSDMHAKQGVCEVTAVYVPR